MVDFLDSLLRAGRPARILGLSARTADGKRLSDMTTTQAAQEIRNALKAKGINSRAVSVKCDQYSMGSSIRVSIKTLAVSLGDVRSIALKHELVRRDESGEILGGGNRFISVEYDWARLSEQVAAVAALLPTQPGDRAVVGALLVVAEGDDTFRICSVNGPDARCYGRSYCARTLIGLGVRASEAA